MQTLWNSLSFVAFIALLSGCFQQAAPERIPTADTLSDCLAAPESLQFAHLTAEEGVLDAFPESLSQCPLLWKLSLRGQTSLAPLPESIQSLKGLRWLDLAEMKLTALPSSLASLPLQRLYLSDNAFTTLPECIAALSSLDYLNLDRNRLAALPESTSWASIRWLRLNHNALSTLPASAASWTSLQRLYLRENRFESVPESILSLPALEQLDLGRNTALKSLPDSIGNLSALTRLDLDYTGLTSLPDSLGKLTNLQTLVLYGCPLPPEEVARIKALLPASCRIEF